MINIYQFGCVQSFQLNEDTLYLLACLEGTLKVKLLHLTDEHGEEGNVHQVIELIPIVVLDNLVCCVFAELLCALQIPASLHFRSQTTLAVSRLNQQGKHRDKRVVFIFRVLLVQSLTQL